MLEKLRNPLGFLVKPVDDTTHRLINYINQDQQMFARASFLVIALVGLECNALGILREKIRVIR